ncbi:MAG: cytochrome c [Archangium sp.]|nr:cytochrome c [Archangium sp.]
MRRITTALFAVLSLIACSEKKVEPEAVAVAPAPVVDAPPAKTVIEVPDFVISTEAADIKKGEELFAAKGCVACHKIGGGKLVGPDLKGVTARREESWIKKMILKPEIMLKEDDVAKKLLAETFVPMPNQGVNPQTELPFILSYLKSAEK